MDREGEVRGERGRSVAVADRERARSVEPAGDVTTSERLRAYRWGRVALWVGVPLACGIWVLANSMDYYPVYDEWVTGRSVPGRQP